MHEDMQRAGVTEEDADQVRGKFPKGSRSAIKLSSRSDFPVINAINGHWQAEYLRAEPLPGCFWYNFVREIV